MNYDRLRQLILTAAFRGQAAEEDNLGPGGNTMATLAKLAPRQKTEAGTVHWFNECVERSRCGDFDERVTVTPGLAAIILERNPDNRNLSERKVTQYASDMLAGNWIYNGETIKIAKTGELNDGQHRLQAIISANKPIVMKLAFGLERDSRTTLDQGFARTAAHYLAMQGIPFGTLQVSVARFAMAYEQSGGASVKADFTNAEVISRVHADPEIHKAAQFADSVRKYAKGLLTPSQIGGLFYVFSDIDEIDATAFLTQVCVGENIKRGDPAFAVRQALAGFDGDIRIDRVEVAMRGWIAFRQGRKLQIAKCLGNLPALI